MPFYMVTVGGGKCLENTQTAHGVLDCLPKYNASQQWTIESDSTDPNIVAFKSCVDDQYLRNNGPTQISGGKIDMGEKQWWTLENGIFPGSCLIRSNACTIASSYLNDYQGRYRDNNYVHMWKLEKSLEFWLTWYLRDVNDESFNPTGSEPSAAADTTDLEAREKALAAKEQKLKDVERREVTLKEREQKAADLEAGLQKQEAALAKREKQATSNAERKKQSSDKAASNGSSQVASKNNDNGMELLKTQNDNLRLQLKVKELEQKLAQATDPSRSPVDGGRAIMFNCGHKAYPPPRKIEKKIVGIMYEGLESRASH